MLSRENLHPYQEKFVRFICDNKRVFGLLDLGLGKSVSTLTAITDLIDGFAVNRVLVVAPLRVANSVWKQEAQKWRHLSHLRVNVATGSEKSRISALSSTADVYVINRENIKWLVDFYGKNWPFDCLVIDESSSFKSNSSQRFKALKKILPFTEYAVLLTGTPSPNGLLDLWAQVYLIDQGATLGRTMTAYKQRFFEADYMGYKFTPREGAKDKIHKLIEPFSLSMSAEDYLQMPDRFDLVEPVQLLPATLKQYQDFEADLVAEIDGHELDAQSAAVLANKLLQFCNGAIYVDDKQNYVETHSAKLDAIAEIIEDNPSENLLVAYNYKSDLERLLKRFSDAVVLDKDPETITRWNNGEIKMLLAHPASAGHGLNLQRGGSVIIWFGLNWSLEYYQQFNGRLHRQGQEKPVRIIHLVVKDCIDERVMRVISDKAATQSDLLNAVKELNK